MNLNSIFTEQLNGSDSIFNFGNKNSSPAPFLFSDIIKICSEDSSLKNAPTETLTNPIDELYAQAENVIKLSPTDFNKFVELISGLIPNSTLPTETVHKVDEAEITKIQFVIPGEQLVALINEFSSKGVKINPELVLPEAANEINKPISFSLKSGANKLSVSINRIKVDESYNRKVISDEFNFVDKIIVNEGLLAALTKENPETNNFLSATAADEIYVSENIKTEVEKESIKTGEFFKAEIIKIIVPKDLHPETSVYIPNNILASEMNASNFNPVDKELLLNANENSPDDLSVNPVNTEAPKNDYQSAIAFENDNTKSLIGAKLPAINDNSEIEVDPSVSITAPNPNKTVSKTNVVYEPSGNTIVNQTSKIDAEGNFDNSEKLIVTKNPVNESLKSTSHNLSREFDFARKSYLTNTQSIPNNEEQTSLNVEVKIPKENIGSKNSKSETGSNSSLSYLLEDLTEDEKSVFKNAVTSGELQKIKFEKTSSVQNLQMNTAVENEPNIAPESEKPLAQVDQKILTKTKIQSNPIGDGSSIITEKVLEPMLSVKATNEELKQVEEGNTTATIANRFVEDSYLTSKESIEPKLTVETAREELKQVEQKIANITGTKQSNPVGDDSSITSEKTIKPMLSVKATNEELRQVEEGNTKATMANRIVEDSNLTSKESTEPKLSVGIIKELKIVVNDEQNIESQAKDPKIKSAGEIKIQENVEVKEKPLPGKQVADADQTQVKEVGKEKDYSVGFTTKGDDPVIQEETVTKVNPTVVIKSPVKVAIKGNANNSYTVLREAGTSSLTSTAGDTEELDSGIKAVASDSDEIGKSDSSVKLDISAKGSDDQKEILRKETIHVSKDARPAVTKNIVPTKMDDSDSEEVELKHESKSEIFNVSKTSTENNFIEPSDNTILVKETVKKDEKEIPTDVKLNPVVETSKIIKVNSAPHEKPNDSVKTNQPPQFVNENEVEKAAINNSITGKTTHELVEDSESISKKASSTIFSDNTLLAGAPESSNELKKPSTKIGNENISNKESQQADAKEIIAKTNLSEEKKVIEESPTFKTTEEQVKSDIKVSENKDQSEHSTGKEKLEAETKLSSEKIQMPSEKIVAGKIETNPAVVYHAAKPNVKEENLTGTKESSEIQLESKNETAEQKHVTHDSPKEHADDESSSSNRNSDESFKNNYTHAVGSRQEFDIEKVKPATEQKTFHEVFKNVKQNEILPEFSKAIQSGEKQSLTLQLTPENLGKVKLVVDLVDNQITTNIEVENENVKQFIQSNIDQLKQNLQSNGIQINNVNISLADYEQRSTKNTAAKKKPGAKDSKERVIEEEPIISARKHMGYNTVEYLA